MLEDDARQEADTIRRAQKGDSAAFGQLYKRHYARIYRTVYALVGNGADAQDVAQTAWLKAWEHLDDFSFASAFTTWLHRIAVNTALDHLRQRKRWRHRFQSFWGRRSEGDAVGALDFPAPRSDPARGLLNDERSSRVGAALARLPEAQRTVLVLKEFEDYTYQEIADTVGCKIGTVLSRIHLARQKLQQILTSDEL